MSHNSLPVADSQEGSPPLADRISPETEITTETRAALVDRARQIMAGRIIPEPLALPPELEKAWQKELAGFPQPPTMKAIHRITDRLALVAHYDGELVAIVTTAHGRTAVVAVGDDEIKALLDGLSQEESAKVMLTDTMPC